MIHNVAQLKELSQASKTLKEMKFLIRGILTIIYNTITVTKTFHFRNIKVERRIFWVIGSFSTIIVSYRGYPKERLLDLVVLEQVEKWSYFCSFSGFIVGTYYAYSCS